MRRAQAGQVYRWRMVQASTMKWMDLSLNASGCTWGVVARDGILLRDLPRLTDHVVMAAANRCAPCYTHTEPRVSQPFGCECMAAASCACSKIFRVRPFWGLSAAAAAQRAPTLHCFPAFTWVAHLS